MSEPFQLNTPLYPIREVSKLTGVNPITLRAWERRYNIVEPIRTESGHRFYNQEHIELLKYVVAQTEKGIPIGQVQTSLFYQPPSSNENSPKKLSLKERLLESVKATDLEKLNQLLDELIASHKTNPHWIDILQSVTLVLKAEQGSELIVQFWEAVLQPKLFSRLNEGLERLPSFFRPTAVWFSDETSLVTVILTMIRLSEQGVYTLMMPKLKTEESSILHALQLYRCQGLAVVDDSASLDLTFWEQWSKSHPSFQIWLCLKQKLPASFEGLHVRELCLLEPKD